MGLLLQAEGNLNGSLVYFSTAIDICPDFVLYWRGYLKSLIELGKVSNAVQKFRESKPVDSSNDIHRIIQNMIGISMLDSNESRFLSLFPQQASIEFAQVFEANGSPDYALKIYNEIYSKMPENEQVKKKIVELKQEISNENIYQHDTLNDDLSGVIDQFRSKRFKEMSDKLDLLLKKFPSSTSALNLRGVASYSLGLYQEAIHFYNAALQLFPKYCDALNNLGQSYAALDKNKEAEIYYERAILYKPDFSVAYNNLGYLLNNQGRFIEAIKKLELAVKIDPIFSEAYNNLGNAYAALGEIDEAIRSFNEAIRTNKNYKDPVLNLLDYYLTSNKLEAFENLLRNSEQTLASNSKDLAFFKAKLLELKGLNDEAAVALASVNEIELSENIRPLFFQMQAKFFERCGEYGKAFESFTKMNKSASQNKAYKSIDAEAYLRQCKNIFKSFENHKDLIRKPTHDRYSKNNLVFIVGFPRSGTTLIDSILRSHSKISVSEEKPILQAVLSNNGELIKLDDLYNMREPDLEVLRQTYVEGLNSSLIGNCKDKIIVDKMPLNLAFLPYMAVLFPRAKIIISVRHPLDCVLSCWMQNFNPNNAMVNFLSIENTSNVYKYVFDIFLLSEKNLILDMHKLKYENLVNDFEVEIRKVLKFLELDWEDNVQNYYDFAASRKRINTPSHDQVIRPLYKDATFRWKKYISEIRDTEKNLSEYIDKLGYTKIY